MMAWMTYTLSVTLLFCGAALAFESAARAWRIPGRWAWALAIAAALIVPAAGPVLFHAPRDYGATLPVSNVDAAHAAPYIGALPAQDGWLSLRQGADGAYVSDQALKTVWIGLSTATLLVFGGAALLLAWQRRGWQRNTVQGTDVLLSPAAGPAAIGFFQPRIVLPVWLMSAPPEQQRLVLAHEQSHLDARDPQLLMLALLAVVLMPWNLPLWWLLRRLRLAIEVDCDARVLKAGHDLQQYGLALLDVAQRRSGMLAGATGMAESGSALEQRIRLMGRRKRRGFSTPLCALLAVGMCAMVAQISPPAFAQEEFVPKMIPRMAVLLPEGMLDTFAGDYQLNDMQAAIVTRKDEQLSLLVSGQKPVLLQPMGDNAFISYQAPLQVRFKKDANGQTTSLTIRLGDDDRVATRISGEAMQQVYQRVAERVTGKKATEGGEPVLRRSIEVAFQGRFYPDDMTPQFAELLERHLPELRKSMAPYGPVLSTQFQGINTNGWDVYRAQHEHGVLDWAILFDAHGKVIDTRYQPVQ
ncbi:M56 family metallopeptidase [Janthinobacterium agaricidamnosum]|uniref:BlaR1 peptidase M56 family protein n=1 Tax=Janthinobacterium agaricidamnosum NBRC 102515 = DSM 9628 TaxID=1349767 RepID=W0V7G8_9BURK|nr:M56 family metallopeptidase [Janthinobacterium agaricidamnosum]CDG83212.1 blaR1 peptidase M56 family protein [Janthinobacterium agaricidamnosum NBRC 102515 = DSM 9628]